MKEKKEVYKVKPLTEGKKNIIPTLMILKLLKIFKKLLKIFLEELLNL